MPDEAAIDFDLPQRDHELAERLDLGSPIWDKNLAWKYLRPEDKLLTAAALADMERFIAEHNGDDDKAGAE